VDRALRTVVRGFSVGLVAIASLLSVGRSCGAQELLPDLIPYVREDLDYLVDWFISDDEIKLHTMFANIGDGLFQIRSTDEGTPGVPEPIYQRVFIGEDMGDDFVDYEINSTVEFVNGEIQFPDYTEFELLEAVIDSEGQVTIGEVVSNHVKTSCFLYNSRRIPESPYNDNPGDYPVDYPNDYGTYQNVNAGWGDIYNYNSQGQFVPIDDVPIGPLYWLRQTVNPAGKMLEKDYTNNSFEILIDLNSEGAAELNADGTFVQPGDHLQLLPGDYNQDGVVNTADFIVYRNHEGTDFPLPNRDPLADGDVGMGDYEFWAENFGATLTPPGSGSSSVAIATPEPATAVLIAIALASALVVLRRIEYDSAISHLSLFG
jgi:hypothetical protein